MTVDSRFIVPNNKLSKNNYLLLFYFILGLNRRQKIFIHALYYYTTFSLIFLCIRAFNCFDLYVLKLIKNGQNVILMINQNYAFKIV